MTSTPANLVIYVFDDDASVRTGLARLMRSAGYRAMTFDCGEDFLAHQVHEPADCVVLDISLPDLSGLQMQKCQTWAAFGIPVIALSARDDDGTRRLARALGCQFLLRKPVDGQALLDVVDWVAGPCGVAPPTLPRS